MLPSVPVRRQIVNTVIAPRRWQCLTLSVRGGNPISTSTASPSAGRHGTGLSQGSDAPVYIGSLGGKRNFLNAKLAAFSIYGEALSADAVRGSYRAERGTYRAKPDAYFPENDSSA